MKPGDVVRYRVFPHEDLHFSGMTGIVLSEPRVLEDESLMAYPQDQLVVIDVMWSEDRPQRQHSTPVLNITWDFIEELELVSESW